MNNMHSVLAGSDRTVGARQRFAERLDQLGARAAHVPAQRTHSNVPEHNPRSRFRTHCTLDYDIKRWRSFHIDSTYSISLENNLCTSLLIVLSFQVCRDLEKISRLWSKYYNRVHILVVSFVCHCNSAIIRISRCGLSLYCIIIYSVSNLSQYYSL